MKDKLLALLENSTSEIQLHWFDSIESTNTEAKKMAKEGAPHGTVLVADRQTGGRGRMGRSFASPAGMGIYLSMILRPACRATELMHLTCAVAVAMCDAIEEVSGFRPGVKWINDLIAKEKKLGGILTELALVPGTDSVEYAIVGIGINCYQKNTDFPEELRHIAISLDEATGKRIDRCRLTAAMITHLQKINGQLLSHKAEIMGRYTTDCITLGQDIYLLQNGEKIPCRALSLDRDGGLKVAFSDGSSRIVSSGEVSVRKQ